MQTKEQRNSKTNFFVVEFPNTNSKVEYPSRATPDREAVTPGQIISDQVSTPTEVMNIKEPIAISALTETQPSNPTDEA